MANFKSKTQGDNKNLQDLVGGQFVLVDGSASLVTVVPLNTGARLLHIVNNTKGLSLNIRTGSRVIGTIGAAVAEGDYPYYVYCENGIQIDVGGSGGNATVVFASQ